MLYSFLFGVFLLILLFILMPILENCDLKRQELEFQEKCKQSLKIYKNEELNKKRLDRYNKRAIISERKHDKKCHKITKYKDIVKIINELEKIKEEREIGERLR